MLSGRDSSPSLDLVFSVHSSKVLVGLLGWAASAEFVPQAFLQRKLDGREWRTNETRYNFNNVHAHKEG